jgi:hypothetical protein
MVVLLSRLPVAAHGRNLSSAVRQAFGKGGAFLENLRFLGPGEENVIEVSRRLKSPGFLQLISKRRAAGNVFFSVRCGRIGRS